MKKIAVVVMNLGGPDSKDAIKPFLFNFFMDKNIIRAPLPVRFLVAKLISVTRSKGAAYESYKELGFKSPLLENSERQAKALEDKLNARSAEDVTYKSFISMRYWHPRASQVIQDVKDWGADHVILLPLYPQYSTTTTRSSFQEWEKELEAAKVEFDGAALCCYPFMYGFLKASKQNIETAYKVLTFKTDAKIRVLFSAHGLPEDIIEDGDSYQWQCEQSAQKIADMLDVPDLDWAICYQSRVGPKKWIGPSTEDELERAVEDGVGVLIYPHAFVNEHVETLVEIEEEYREMAEEMGIKAFGRVPTVDAADAFIGDLASAVAKRTQRLIAHDKQNGESICPETCGRCMVRTGLKTMPVEPIVA